MGEFERGRQVMLIVIWFVYGNVRGLLLLGNQKGHLRFFGELSCRCHMVMVVSLLSKRTNSCMESQRFKKYLTPVTTW